MRYNSLSHVAPLCLLLFICAPALPKSTTHSSRVVISDDGAKDASFSAFRSQLLEAVKRRDRKFVEQIVSPRIETGLGAATGRLAFNQQWQNLSASSPFWARMERVLNHGAKYEKLTGEYEAPAIDFENSESNEIQAAVWNKQSVLHKSPNRSSPGVRSLDCELVALLKPADPSPITEEWVEVKTKDGETGFLRSEDIFSAYDEYAGFKKLKGKWWLTWFGFAGL